MSSVERFLVLCTIAPLVARTIDDLPFTPTADGSAIQYEGPLPDTLLQVYPKVPGYEVRRVIAPAPAPATVPYAPPPPPSQPQQVAPAEGAAVDAGQAVETKAYADGTQATGVAPLPEQSPAQQEAAAAAASDGAKKTPAKGKGGKAAG
jgi:hypothetical protein